MKFSAFFELVNQYCVICSKYITFLICIFYSTVTNSTKIIVVLDIVMMCVTILSQNAYCLVTHQG